MSIEEIETLAIFMGYEGQHEEWCGNNILIDDNFSETGKIMIAYNPDSNWCQLMDIIHRIKVLCVNHPELSYSKFKKVLHCTINIDIEILVIRVHNFVSWYNTCKK